MTLRDYQLKQVDDLRAGFHAGVRRQLLCSPTGSGKGVVFSFMACGAANKGLRTLILAHRSEILDQISDHLECFGVDFGQIRAGVDSDPSRMVQIASVQTLVRRFERVSYPDFIIIDEAHHSAAESWKKVFAAFPNAKIVGVTATPERLTGEPLSPYFDRLVLGPSVQRLIDHGFLKKPVYYAPEHAVDLSGVAKVAGDYQKTALADAMDRPGITGDAVKTYQKLGRGLPAVAFCVNLKHAASVAEAFRAAGIRAEVIEGSMEANERRAMKARLASGETRILVSCELVSEGFDLPAVGCAIKLRPTLSLALNLQQDGRALRPSPGVTEAVILDHVGNWERHGLAHWDRQWSLEGHAGKKRDKEQAIALSQCPSCFCISTSSTCPECGFVRPCKVRELRQREGELRAIEEAQAREKFQRKKAEWNCRSLADWQELGRQRNYKPFWAIVRWKASRWHKKTEPQLQLTCPICGEKWHACVGQTRFVETHYTVNCHRCGETIEVRVPKSP